MKSLVRRALPSRLISSRPVPSPLIPSPLIPSLAVSKVLNSMYSDDARGEIDGRFHPDFKSRLTMLGRRRLDNTQALLSAVIAEGTPGGASEQEQAKFT